MNAVITITTIIVNVVLVPNIISSVPNLAISNQIRQGLTSDRRRAPNSPTIPASSYSVKYRKMICQVSVARTRY